jgi:hypothetical protein
MRTTASRILRLSIPYEKSNAKAVPPKGEGLAPAHGKLRSQLLDSRAVYQTI